MTGCAHKRLPGYKPPGRQQRQQRKGKKRPARGQGEHARGNLDEQRGLGEIKQRDAAVERDLHLLQLPQIGL